MVKSHTLKQTKGRASKKAAAALEAKAKLAKAAKVSKHISLVKTSDLKKHLTKVKLAKLLALDSSDEEAEDDEVEDDEEQENDGNGDNEEGEDEVGMDARRFFKLIRAPELKISQAERKKRGIESMYQAIRILDRNLTEYSNPTSILTDGVGIASIDGRPDFPPMVHQKFNHLVLSEMLWPEFLKWIPGLRKHAEAMSKDIDLVCHLGEYIMGVAKKTHSDDLPRIKEAIIKLAHISDPDHELDNKAARGWNNTATARLLCPISDLDEFEQDPVKYCQRVKRGKIPILSEDWPVLCYEERCDPHDAKRGLFRRKLAVKCYQLIFTGKGSALDEYYQASNKGKPPISKKAKLEKVTIGSIAYIHLLMRSALTSQRQWEDCDGLHWTGADFTQSIFQAAFESPHWAADLEAWWTQQVFGTGDEEPVEVQEKRKMTMFALFKRTSERTVEREMREMSNNQSNKQPRVNLARPSRTQSAGREHHNDDENRTYRKNRHEEGRARARRARDDSEACDADDAHNATGKDCADHEPRKNGVKLVLSADRDSEEEDRRVTAPEDRSFDWAEVGATSVAANVGDHEDDADRLGDNVAAAGTKILEGTARDDVEEMYADENDTA